jgi:ferredoxin
VITEVIPAPKDAEQWDGVQNKINNLIIETK